MTHFADRCLTPRHQHAEVGRSARRRPAVAQRRDLAVFEYEDARRPEPSIPLQPGPARWIDALPDRRSFEEEAVRHVAFARRNGHPLCFALIAFQGWTRRRRRMLPTMRRSSRPPRAGARCFAPRISLAAGAPTSSPSCCRTARPSARCSLLAPSRGNAQRPFVLCRARVLPGTEASTSFLSAQTTASIRRSRKVAIAPSLRVSSTSTDRGARPPTLCTVLWWPFDHMTHHIARA